MNLIGVVGKSGSGKSYVCKLLSERLNATYISFDSISHEVTKTENYKNFIQKLIGSSVFENGQLDRKKLGNIIFKNQELLEKINNFAELEMVKIIDAKLKSISQEYIILDYALLPLMKYYDKCSFKIYVKADDNVRKARVLERDKISEEYFNLRDNSLNFYDKISYDYLLVNNFVELQKLGSEIEKIVQIIKNLEDKNA